MYVVLDWISAPVAPYVVLPILGCMIGFVFGRVSGWPLWHVRVFVPAPTPEQPPLPRWVTRLVRD